MEKIKQILQSKKFWTLVSAIVAALAAYFATSCAAATYTRSHGVHCDTVLIESKSRTKNYQRFDL